MRGAEGAVVVGEVEAMKGNKGYNAVTGEFEDLAAAGIVDPTKVVRTALQKRRFNCRVAVNNRGGNYRYAGNQRKQLHQCRVEMITITRESPGTLVLDLSKAKVPTSKFSVFVIAQFRIFHSFGSRIAGSMLPVLVIALKRNGAYAGDI